MLTKIRTVVGLVDLGLQMREPSDADVSRSIRYPASGRLNHIGACQSMGPESWIEAIPETLTKAEIALFFRLGESSLQIATSRRRPMTRIGLVLHIGFLRMSGRHLSALERVLLSVLAFAGNETGVAAPQLATLPAIYRRRMTLFAHQRLAASRSAGCGN